MRASLPPVPASGQLTVRIEPEIYNTIRLAVLRLDTPLKTVLGGKGVEVHIHRDAWVCFDLRLGYQPALAWTGFETARDAFKEPVNAQALVYNSYAKLFLHSVLPELARRLERRMKETFPPGARVLAFPGSP